MIEVDGHSCRVLVRGSAAASNARVIVVGLNGSKESWNAFRWECAEAPHLASSIVAVLVGPADSFKARLDQPVQPSTNVVAASDDPKRLEGLRYQVQQHAARFGVNITFSHVRGDPVAEVLRIADYYRSNLIVAGRSTSAPYDFTGSLARTCSNSRDLPIVVDVS